LTLFCLPQVKKKARQFIDHGLWKSILLRQPGYPRRTRGFPSHDYSWFGFVGNVGFNFPNILRAISMPKGVGCLNPLIFKDLLENGNFNKDRIVTFFVLKNNYLVTIINMTL
jgi:hypothetical protein